MRSFHPSVLPIWPRPGLTPVRSARHERLVYELHRIHAASLRPLGAAGREGARKQKTPGTAIPEVFTAHPLMPQEVRAASAQSDTSH